MSKAVGILELSSIAKGMETGDAMLKSANVELLVSKTLCPGKFLLMLGGDVGAVQQAINSGASLAGEMLVDSLVLPNIHPSYDLIILLYLFFNLLIYHIYPLYHSKSLFRKTA